MVSVTFPSLRFNYTLSCSNILTVGLANLTSLMTICGQIGFFVIGMVSDSVR